MEASWTLLLPDLDCRPFSVEFIFDFRLGSSIAVMLFEMP